MITLKEKPRDIEEEYQQIKKQVEEYKKKSKSQTPKSSDKKDIAPITTETVSPPKSEKEPAVPTKRKYDTIQKI